MLQEIEGGFVVFVVKWNEEMPDHLWPLALFCISNPVETPTQCLQEVTILSLAGQSNSLDSPSCLGLHLHACDLNPRSMFCTLVLYWIMVWPKACNVRATRHIHFPRQMMRTWVTRQLTSSCRVEDRKLIADAAGNWRRFCCFCCEVEWRDARSSLTSCTILHKQSCGDNDPMSAGGDNPVVGRPI